MRGELNTTQMDAIGDESNALMADCRKMAIRLNSMLDALEDMGVVTDVVSLRDMVPGQVADFHRIQLVFQDPQHRRENS